MRKYRLLICSLGLIVSLAGCSFLQNGEADESASEASWEKNPGASANTGDSDAADKAASDDLASDGEQNDLGEYKEFLDGTKSALGNYEGNEYEVWYNKLPHDADDWESYSVSDERVDLDNDGKYELILNGPYGGMYIDERNGEYYVLAEGEGTAGELGHVEYDGKMYIFHRDVSHGGRKIYLFDCYNQDGEKVDSFDLSAEYWDAEFDYYNSDSDFTYRGQKITMDEYEKLMKEIMNSPTKVEYGEILASHEFDTEDDSPKIAYDGSDTFYDAMDEFYGEYTYKKSSDGLDGTLSIIQEFDNSREYSIFDGNTNGYRFTALGSNVEYIKGNKMFMKYPETVYEDGAEVFKYYIIARRDDCIFLFETDENYENPAYIYTAWEKY